MAEILPRNLNPAASVSNSAAIIVDDGTNVEKGSPLQIVDAAIPLASQAEAEAGSDNSKRVTPLRVAQAIASQSAGKANASALGIAGSDSNMGTYTGSTIPDNETAKQNIQSLETAVEAKATAASLGVSASASDMGSFTGSTIPDSQTAKEALQSLETAVEARTTIADLASTASGKGSGLVKWISSLAGATGRWLSEKLSDTISVKDFGAVGDGVADDTAAIQAAFDAASGVGKSIYVPAGVYKLTAQIDCDAGVQVYGEGCFLEVGGAANAQDGGSWFYLAHTGIGFYCRDDAAVGVSKAFTRFDGIGTYRSHAAPGVGWTPTVCSEDFRVEFRVFLDRVTLLNPYIGVKVRSAGVLWIGDLLGQPLYTGIEVERSSDVQNWTNIHFWPFWSQDSNVTSSTIDNAVGVRVRRSDGLRIGNIFSYGYAWTIDAQDVSGDLSGFAGFDIGSLYADKAGGGVRITSDYYPAHGTINNILVNSDSAVGGVGPAVEIAGAVASQVNILGLSVTRAHEEALKVHEAAHSVQCQPFKVEAWDRLSAGHYAFKADNGARINLLSIPEFSVSPTNLYSQGTSGIITLPRSGRVRTSLTIASGAVTVADGGGMYFIDTETAAATDDLDTINGGKEGDIIRIRSANSSRDTTLKDGTGNLFLNGDFALMTNTYVITLENVSGTQWHEIARSAN